MSERPAAQRCVLLVLAEGQQESGRMFALWAAAALLQLKAVPNRQEGGRDRGLVRTCLSESRREDGEQREGVWQSGAA